MCVEFIEEGVKEPRGNEAVGVDEQQEVRRTRSRAQIGSGREAGVGRESDEAHSSRSGVDRRALPRRRLAAVRRCIVNDHNFPIAISQSGIERDETLRQMRTAVEVDDDDGYVAV